MILQGDALDLIQAERLPFDLIVTDPPYAFGGSGGEHALSATVAVVLREAALRLNRNRWMLVFAASSWRSTAYMVEALRGVVEPVRIGTWTKPQSRTKVTTTGWRWASVSVIVFRKGRPPAGPGLTSSHLDHIESAPITNGRRAELPPSVAQWAVEPYVFPGSGGRFLDPFAGSGALVRAAEYCGMESIGYEREAAAA